MKKTEFKAGDPVGSLWGEGVLMESDDDIYPLELNGRTFTVDGKLYKSYIHPSIWHIDDNPFEKAAKWDALQRGATPTTTPKPTIDRNELIDMVKAVGNVQKAIALLTEINKEAGV